MGDLLNIRCGDDIRDRLAHLVGGDFLSDADPITQGPVPDLPSDELREVRAGFLHEAYGIELGWARERLAGADAALAGAVAYDQVVLWFEHDAYDQLILVRVLDQLGDLRNLALMSIDDFPGSRPFIGLGQLTTDQFASLIGREAPVTAAQVALARRTWAALRSPDPDGLQAIMDEGDLALPFLARALGRHLRDLPWITDGLSLTERLCLRALSRGAATLETIFPAVQGEDPLPGHGDVQVAYVLDGLSRGDTPLATVQDRQWSATPAAAEVLAGVRVWVGPPRWLGGVRLTPDCPWVWDGTSGRVSRRGSSAR